MASRHVIDGRFDPRECAQLAAAAAAGLDCLRLPDGEASVAALGRGNAVETC